MIPPVDNSETFLSSCPACGGVIDVSTLEPYSKIDCPHCSSGVRVRHQFNHFSLTKQIGEGGMSRVFDAIDPSLGRHVALKILNRHYSKDSIRMASFEREAQLTAAVAHPNVIKCYSVGRDQGNFYIAMELVGGGSLEQRISEQGRLNEKEALRVGRAVAEGLRAAYREGLIHRDVKPANILFTDEDVPKIVDFGLALFHERDVDDSGEIWATPFYVAPEKVKDDREDFRSDIFSLGATLFHALTGKPPHKANTNSIRELKIIKSRAVSLEDSGLKFSSRTCDVVDRMLALRPEDRFQSYDELVEAFRDAESLLGYSAISKRSRRRQLAYAVAGLSVCLLLLAILIRPAPAPEEVSTVDTGDHGVEQTQLQDLKTSQNLAQGTVTVSEEFLRARSILLDGRYDEARKVFDALIYWERTKQPTLNWARFNAALCAMVAGNKNDAEAYFAKMAKEPGVGLPAVSPVVGNFFSQFGKAMEKNLGLGADAGKVAYQKTSEESLGYLGMGIAEWHFGDPQIAGRWLTLFNESVPAKGLEWVSSYKVLTASYLADLEAARIMVASRKQPYKTSFEAREALATNREVLGQLKTRGVLRERVAANVQFAEAEIDRLKRADADSEQNRMVAVRQRELTQFADLAENLPALVRGYDYSAIVELLDGMRFESPEVQTALENKFYVWSKAKEFMDCLAADVAANGYAGVIQRRTGTPVQGQLVKLDYLNSTVTLDRGQVYMPTESFSPAALVTIAQYYSEKIVDSTDYYRRQELIAIFAKVQGLDQTATQVASQLMEENRAFRQRWVMVEQNGW